MLFKLLKGKHFFVTLQIFLLHFGQRKIARGLPERFGFICCYGIIILIGLLQNKSCLATQMRNTGHP